MDSARRGFLRGRPTAPAAAPATPATPATGAAPPALLRGIGPGCLALQRIECRVCGELCGEGAIRFRPTLGTVAQPQLQPERCTGCGDCIAACPVQALRLS